jgi:hypothetical protein
MPMVLICHLLTRHTDSHRLTVLQGQPQALSNVILLQVSTDLEEGEIQDELPIGEGHQLTAGLSDLRVDYYAGFSYELIVLS